MKFDLDAERFDARAGIPRDAFEALGTRLAALGVARGGAWLDIGAGTGQLARALSGHAGHYLALDRSPGMWAQWPDPNPSIGRLLADADADWPVLDQSLSVVCLLRVAHLLEPAHLERSLRRTCRPGAWVLLLRRLRDPGSAREKLRREMRARVERLRGRDSARPAGGDRHAEVERTLRRATGDAAQPVEVSRWQTSSTLRAQLDAWGGKDGLAGGSLATAPKRALLGGLAQWAGQALGELDGLQPCEERLVLWPFRMNAGGRSGTPGG